jgi:hypothetical protein
MLAGGGDSKVLIRHADQNGAFERKVLLRRKELFALISGQPSYEEK